MCITMEPLALVLIFSFIIATDSEYVIITENYITSLSDNFDEKVSHNITTKFPSICAHAPANCQPLLLPLANNDSVLLIPYNDHVKYLKLTDTGFLDGGQLHLPECLNAFLAGNGSDVYAICLKNRTHEITTAAYKIQYTKHFGLLKTFQYDRRTVDGTQLVLNNSFTVTYSNATGPVVLYIVDHGSDAKLIINDVQGSDEVFLPSKSDCASPYELRHLYQPYILLKCSNGFVYLYNHDTSNLTKLPVQNVTMVEECDNASSFVMVTSQGTIYLNRASNSFINPSFKIASISFQPGTVSSLTCHCNGTVTNLYYTISQDNDDAIYHMLIQLEYAAESITMTKPHLMLKLFNLDQEPPHSFNVIQSNIVGSAWVIKHFDSNRDVQKTVLIDIDNGKSHVYTSDGIAYIQHLKSVDQDITQMLPSKPDQMPYPEYTNDNDQGIRDNNPQWSGESFFEILIGISITAVILEVIVIVIVYTFVIKRFIRRHRLNSKLKGSENYDEAEKTFTSAQLDHENETHLPKASTLGNLNFNSSTTENNLPSVIVESNNVEDNQERIELRHYCALESDYLSANGAEMISINNQPDLNTTVVHTNSDPLQCNNLAAINDVPLGSDQSIHTIHQDDYQIVTDNQSTGIDQDDNQSPTYDQHDNQLVYNQGEDQLANNQGDNQSLVNDQDDNHLANDQDNNPGESANDHSNNPGDNPNSANDQGDNQIPADDQGDNQPADDQGRNSPNDDHTLSSDESSIESHSPTSESADQGTDVPSSIVISRPMPFGDIMIVTSSIPRNNSPGHHNSDDDTEIPSDN